MGSSRKRVWVFVMNVSEFDLNFSLCSYGVIVFVLFCNKDTGFDLSFPFEEVVICCCCFLIKRYVESVSRCLSCCCCCGHPLQSGGCCCWQQWSCPVSSHIVHESSCDVWSCPDDRQHMDIEGTCMAFPRYGSAGVWTGDQIGKTPDHRLDKCMALIRCGGACDGSACRIEQMIDCRHHMHRIWMVFAGCCCYCDSFRVNPVSSWLYWVMVILSPDGGDRWQGNPLHWWAGYWMMMRRICCSACYCCYCCCDCCSDDDWPCVWLIGHAC